MLCGDCSEPALIGVFMGGLKEEIRIELMTLDPHTLDGCFFRTQIV
jgi:hypothetical protein